MNKPQTVKFLMDLGIKKEKAEKMAAGIPSDAAETPADELEEALTSAVSHQRELYTNSDEYKGTLKKIKDGAIAEIHTKAEKKLIAAAGLSPEEVKDKKYDEIVDLAWAKAAKSGNKSLDEVQAELVRVSNELKKVNEEEIPKIKSEVEREKLAFKTDSSLLKKIGSLKLRKGSDPEDGLILAKAKAERLGYKVGLDEKGELTFLTADGNKIMTTDKKDFLKADNILSEFLDSMIEKSGGKEDEVEKKKTVIKGAEDDDDDKPHRRSGSAVNAARAKAEEHARRLGEAAE